MKLMSNSNSIELYEQKMKEYQKPALLEIRMHVCNIHLPTGRSMASTYSSVLLQQIRVMLNITKHRNMESSLHQLCWMAFQISSFRNAEEKSHLTCFSKNIQVQNLRFSVTWSLAELRRRDYLQELKYGSFMLVGFCRKISIKTTKKDCKQRTSTLN